MTTLFTLIGNVNLFDKETIDIELQLKDLDTVEKRLEKVNRAKREIKKRKQKNTFGQNQRNFASGKICEISFPGT
jgi:ribosome-binding ATPase YchF (GTP1/OBG family)